MKLIVFGANGGVGKEVVTLALQAGHEVVGVVRGPAVASSERQGLHMVEGSITDAVFVAGIVKGADVVISTIGASDSKHPVSLYSLAAQALVGALKGAPHQRLIVLSAGGATIEKNDPLLFRLIVKPLLQRVFHYLYEDMLRMERVLETSNLDWTILRLSYLTNKPGKGVYRTAHNAAVRYGFSINRADVAHYIVGHLADPQDSRQHVCIAY
jgi:putative NADH-flavin reductase